MLVDYEWLLKLEEIFYWEKKPPIQLIIDGLEQWRNIIKLLLIIIFIKFVSFK